MHLARVASASRWRFAVDGATGCKAVRSRLCRATIPCGDRVSPSHTTRARILALVLHGHNAALHQATALVLRLQALSHFLRLLPSSVPSSWAAANWSLEWTSTGMALGPRSAAGLCCASRAKRHSGSGPSAQTLGRTAESMPLPQINRNKTGGWVLIGGALLLSVLLGHEVFALFQAVQAKSWSSVSGTVVESRAAIGCGKGGSFYPLVRYTYTYNSREYEGRRIAFGNSGCGSEQSASNAAAAYPPGQGVTVWVNPSVPSEAALMVGNVMGESWFAMAVLPIIGLASFLMGRSLLRQESAA